jgi:hypothetical protein
MPLTKGQQSIYESIEGFEIKDPYHLLCLMDPNVSSGKATLYDWQIETLMEFGRDRRDENDIIRQCVVANNGSGKSQMLVSPCAAWLPMRFKKGRVVLTTASGSQLDSQVNRSLQSLLFAINRFYREKFGFPEDVWQTNERKFTFLPTGGVIDCFATDEPGKAEGYHPMDVGAEFAIIVDEAKSIHEDIYTALLRCNGITRRIDVSSPGGPKGHFYDVFTSKTWWTKRVTYLDCPRHIKENEVAEFKRVKGEASEAFRSAYLAEFTSSEEQVVISFEAMKKAYEGNPLFQHYSLDQEDITQGGRFAGLDLAAGGDENVLSIFEGNTQIALEFFKHVDTTVTVDWLIAQFKRYNLKAENVNADDGGVGHAVIDMLWRRGYMVQRIINQGRPSDTVTYGNLGAENWFNFKRYVEESAVKLLPDEKQKMQLSNRYYRRPNNGKIFLESKPEAKARGHKSPDRADATVNAWRFKPFNITYAIMRGTAATTVGRVDKGLTMDEIVEKMESVKYNLDNVSMGKRDSSGRFNYTEYVGAGENNSKQQGSVSGYTEQIDNLNNFLKRN